MLASPIIRLADLDGRTGTRFAGFEPLGAVGRSVSNAGDVNGDGFDDILIGANYLGDGQEGGAFLVFGRAGGFGARFELSALTGANGFRFDGETGFDLAGGSVAIAGDVNGDGFDDILVGVRLGDPGGRENAGEAALIFGAASGFAATEAPDARFGGPDAGDQAGFSVSAAGDFDGDGIADLLIGAPLGESTGSNRGQAYVIYGTGAGFPANFDLAGVNGANGLLVNGVLDEETAGRAVAFAGDLNGDGFDDIAIGAPFADRGGLTNNGAVFVLFGAAGRRANPFELANLDGANGFTLIGAEPNERFGYSISAAGDVNGDGLDDLLVGAPGSYGDAGRAHVIFGREGAFPAEFAVSSLDGTNGFTLLGAGFSDRAGLAVSGGGDFNGDGIADIAVAAPFAGTEGRNSAGKVYVVFGKTGGFAPEIALDALDGSDGLILEGFIRSGLAGFSVAFAGDVNGDGRDDVLIGGIHTDTNAGGTGDAFLLYGFDPGAASAHDDILRGTMAGERMNGFAGDDTLRGRGGDDTLIGALGDDVAAGGAGADRLIGRAGADTLRGGAGEDFARGGGGDDVIRGGGGADRLLGNGGGDVIRGGGGADLIVGGRGDDTLIGGPGADVFVFAPGDGSDEIRRFRQGQDQIEIRRGTADFEALAIEQDGADALIFYNGGSIRVTNANAEAFDAGDFLF